MFLGDFLEPTGPGAGVRGDFAADGVPLVRWASANFDFFRGFFTFFDRFLPVFRPFFALFPSMPCAYLYVNNFFSASLARDLLTSNRKGRKARKGRTRGTTNGASPNHRKDAEGDWGMIRMRMERRRIKSFSLVARGSTCGQGRRRPGIAGCGAICSCGGFWGLIQ